MNVTVRITRQRRYRALTGLIYFVALLGTWASFRGHVVPGVFWLLCALALNEYRERAYQEELWGR